ncbi:hypothetical protein WG907_12340 [Sphingobium sp. AN558]|uniref:hypothetical protein n=1 Tax=Sphingobium sp. AN558 TaxID=3133442 RepID=UPI0030C0997B
MKALLTPTATETVRNVRQALEDWIRPATEGSSASSYATTAIVLCRHVEIRLEQEGQQLFDEIARLHVLLARAADVMASHPHGARLVPGLRRVLSEKRDPSIYPSLSLTSEDVARLRQHVCDIQEIIIPEDEAGKALPEVKALRAEIRHYIGWQLEQQQKIVESAFRGNGPRR